MWCAKSDVVWRKSKDTLVLLNTSSGLYYTVNPTGALLWSSLVEKGTSFDEAVSSIQQEFAGAPDAAAIRTDCARMLEEWKAEKLIEEKAGSGAKA